VHKPGVGCEGIGRGPAIGEEDDRADARLVAEALTAVVRVADESDHAASGIRPVDAEASTGERFHDERGAAANPLIATTPPLTVRTSDQKETFPVPVMTSEAEIGALLRSHLPLADFFAISKKLPVTATEPVILA
jgi:hypothetical protein